MSEPDTVPREACRDCTSCHEDLKNSISEAEDSAVLKENVFTLHEAKKSDASEISSPTMQRAPLDLSCTFATPHSNVQNLGMSSKATSPREPPCFSPTNLVDSFAVSVNSEDLKSHHTSGLTTSATTTVLRDVIQRLSATRSAGLHSHAENARRTFVSASALMAMIATPTMSSPPPRNSNLPPPDHSKSCSKIDARKYRGAGSRKNGTPNRSEKRPKQPSEQGVGNDLGMVEMPIDRRLRAVCGILSVLIAGQDRILAQIEAKVPNSSCEDFVAKECHEGTENARTFSLISEGTSPNDLTSSEPNKSTVQECAGSISPLCPSSKELATPANDTKLTEDCDNLQSYKNKEKQKSVQHENEFTKDSTGSKSCCIEDSCNASQDEASAEETDNLKTTGSDENNSTQAGFSSIVGSSAAKDALLEAVVLPLRLGKLAGPGGSPLFSGLRQAGHVLLYGPPGTGKTTLAAAAAAEAGAAFVSVPPSAVLSKYQGESERAVRRLFTAARARTDRPTVIFFDEADSLAPSRSGFDDLQARRMLAEVLVQLSALDDPASSADASARPELPCDDSRACGPTRVSRCSSSKLGNCNEGVQGSFRRRDMHDEPIDGKDGGHLTSYCGRSTVPKSILRGSKRARCSNADDSRRPVRDSHPSHRSSHMNLGDSNLPKKHLEDSKHSSSVCESRYLSGCTYNGSMTSRTNDVPLPVSAPPLPPRQPVVVVAATNLVNDLDPAFLRRFTSRVLVDSPPNEDRALLLAHFLSGLAHSLIDAHFQCLATATDGWSGSDLKCLARHAAMQPLRRLFRSISRDDCSNLSDKSRFNNSTTATTAKAAAALSTASSNGGLATGIIVIPSDFVDAYAALAPTISGSFEVSTVHSLAEALEAIPCPINTFSSSSNSIGTPAVVSNNGEVDSYYSKCDHTSINSTKTCHENACGVKTTKTAKSYEANSATMVTSLHSSSREKSTLDSNPEFAQTDTLSMKHYVAHHQPIFPSKDYTTIEDSKLASTIDERVPTLDLSATENAEGSPNVSTVAAQAALKVLNVGNALVDDVAVTLTTEVTSMAAVSVQGAAKLADAGSASPDATDVTVGSVLGVLSNHDEIDLISYDAKCTVQSPTKKSRTLSLSSPRSTLLPQQLPEHTVCQSTSTRHIVMDSMSKTPHTSSASLLPEVETRPLLVSGGCTPPSPSKEKLESKAMAESPATKMPPPPAKPPKLRKSDASNRGIASPCLTISTPVDSKESQRCALPPKTKEAPNSSDVLATLPAAASAYSSLPLPGQRRPWIPPKPT